jgi:DNA mismatch endonuclease (patch repair protein)
MMAGIRSKNTKPEILIRKGLHARGLRYSLHSKNLPGKPDIVMPKWKVIIFVHGCFWHRHECALSTLPENNRDFWRKKLSENFDRDLVTATALLSAGWRVAYVWECALRSKSALQQLDRGIDALVSWVKTPAAGVFTELPFISD